MLTDLPNILTLLRIASIPVLIALIAFNNAWTDGIACVLYIAACITDYLDGMLARRWKQGSELGRMMDPIADKLLVGALLLALAGYGRLVDGALFAAIIILVREIMVSGLREFMASQRATLPSTRLAKWKTGIQMVAIGCLLAGDVMPRQIGLGAISFTHLGAVMLWVSVVPTVMSGWGYLVTGLAKMLGTGTNGSSAKLTH
ncbi:MULTISPECIES: CDP-diacylglycerol--glycerol-3-phosphate 3-phosphatidyltransferase [Asaia]|uniref:CDP-diacylglycerol--glycerol-3-phosphate 3-phosphatidyltransferase n=2 Tax=Asaia bogorensis TaxID=91915 RepID=A0AAN4R467_9PROT|nr:MULTISPECIES: CDP-diacylglycerol--glycerol-3-phosphate 3-phosphatidyltransferase [Asaia]ETC99864.1 CDP-diacylglycerol--glycerol-3-phosphate 3-phosphatidyltransferase [Asaia sp. SF2.1]MDL2172264.1 CDP-diacylglycerol--glycerol-3-phosphate 3-phosphatidyltransferase [Asaia sp. HumB]MDR6181831.1 cardiolipin synthase [Asaia bogorensis NBRC 16594]CDG39417.1 CDP-diacylglycerol--glycerol-3-phosphate 3-phosphatidyltransferase [Asaia bogorensis]BAT19498.1 CDP-diacylglycerol--glycerol-3-phosphate 3-pho